jgi:7-cyano-7-deazaguanine synthase in queuosine biosynthesis
MPMSECLVICGKLSVNAAAAKDFIALDVDAPEHAPNRVNLTLGDISSRMVQDVPRVLVDLLELAVYVYCADQFRGRGGDTIPELGKKWRRTFRFHVPVRCPEVWSRSDVQDLLIETLGFLSDDDYTFEFVRHPDPVPPGLQHHLNFAGSEDRGFVPDDVILFSGGLDSFAGAVESLIGRGRKAALVSHQAAPMIISKQSRLVAALRERTERFQLFHVPIGVNKGHEEAAEFTQRSRSFLFATLGLVVANLFGRNAIQFCENGVVSVNLPVSSHVLGTRATRTTHPRVLAELSRLFSVVLADPVTVENPYFWKTKTDLVRSIADHGCADLIAETLSCTRVREATRRKRHCGVCSQCIDRRFGVLGADLGEYEPTDAYVIDLFRGERKPGPDVTMTESYVLHALKLAAMSEQTFFNSFGQIFRVLPYLPGSPEENAGKLHDLHRRHGQTVEAVINRELAHHATLTRSLSLPQTSLLMLIQSSAVRLPATVDPAELEPPASEQAAVDRSRSLERPLVFAIDEKRRRILFRGGIEIRGVGFDLVKALAVEFMEDVRSALGPDDFRFVKTEDLAGRVGIDQQGLRQRITRLRDAIERKFLEALDVQLTDDDVIQNDPRRGYRLNPYLLLVEPGQVHAAIRS